MKVRVITKNNIRINGMAADELLMFKGIPYAKAPTGERRWKAPQPFEGKNITIDALEFGNSPMQTDDETEWLQKQGEDCLFLNVWKSADNKSASSPVLVYIYGGAFGYGTTSDPLIDGSGFVRSHKDIIYVSINYRVGLMGFMDFSEVEGCEEFPDATFLGLLDQRMALQWIHENISAFGGDPERITIMGESAGAASVAFHLADKKSHPYFKRAISHSGAAAVSFDKDSCLTVTRRLLKVTGAKCMDDLMALSEEEIRKADWAEQEAIESGYEPLYNMPERDGVHLPVDIMEIYDKYLDKGAAEKELLIGTMANEWNFYISAMFTGDREKDFTAFSDWVEKKLKYHVNHLPEEDRLIAEEFIENQKDKGHPLDFIEFLNEVEFRAPAIKTAEKHSAGGGSTYMYHWRYPSSIPHYGACHTLDLAYVFNTPYEYIAGPELNQTVVKDVQDAWANFVRTGDPSTHKYFWPLYKQDERETMVIDEKWSIQKDPMSDQYRLAEKLLKNGICTGKITGDLY